MKFNFAILTFVFSCFLLSSCQSFHTAASESVGEYGAKISYSDKSAKRFPDLTVKFIERRDIKVPGYNGNFSYYDFVVSKDGEKKIISWSSGTGDIGPAFFSIGGKDYVLELSASEGFQGFLNEGEMVVWQRRDFEKLLAKKR